MEKVKKFDWQNPEISLPEIDEIVLVVVTGKCRCVSFLEAFQLAEYAGSEEWILEGYPEAENLTVHAWAHIPDFSGEF